MVSVVAGFSSLSPEELQRSADAAIRNLLATRADVLALATYLWVSDEYDIPLVNRAALIRWGRTWPQSVLLENSPGQRADEAITSAALIVATLYNDRHAPGYRADLVTAVRSLIASMLPSESILFNRPGYASILLYAAARLGIRDPNLVAAADATVTLLTAPHCSRLFGIGFASRTLRSIGSRQVTEQLTSVIQARLQEPELDYEDQLYLAEALFALTSDGQSAKRVLPALSRTVASSPMSPFLTAGFGQVEPASDGFTHPPISDLYRALLLALVFAVYRTEHDNREELIDARYKGRRLTGLLASIGTLSVLVIIWCAVIAMLTSYGTAGIHYWLFKDFSAMTSDAALRFIAFAFTIPLIVMESGIFSWTSWNTLVVGAVESDRRYLEILLRRTKVAVKLWLGFVVIAILTNLVATFIAPATANLLGVP